MKLKEVNPFKSIEETIEKANNSEIVKLFSGIHAVVVELIDYIDRLQFLPSSKARLMKPSNCFTLMSSMSLMRKL